MPFYLPSSRCVTLSESAEKEATVKDGHVSAARREAANLRSRRSKRIIPRNVLMKAWQQEIQRQQLVLPQIPHAQPLSKEHPLKTQRAIQGGIDHASEREAVFRRSKVERFVLENHLGQQSFGELQKAIEDNGELIQAEPLQDKYTTQAAIHRELETIRLMQSGKGMVEAIASSTEIERLLEEAPTLSDGQQRAIEMSAMSGDRILAWQGVAGSGKTYSLKLFSELATEKGYTVRGFAPSAEAAHELARAAQIPSDTVASLLVQQADTQHTILAGKTIWIVDEAGLLSAKDAHALLQRAAIEQARVILVGDTRQLSAVEAGNPFKSLQAGGIQTAYLEESRRQKTQELKAAIALIETGQMEQAIQHLEKTGAIHALPEQAQRFQAVAQDYLSLSTAERSRTLLLAGTHAERLALTAKIRQALQTRGELGADTYSITSLRTRDLTTAQATYASYYEPGDVIVPSQDYRSQGLVKYQQYQVVECDGASNQLTVENPSGQLLTINPAKCQRKTVYAIQEIAIAEGDRLRWTRNHRATKIRNGQQFTVTEIDRDGNAQIVDDRGNLSHVNLQGHQYVDYALVSTIYSSQGKTADRVLALMDGTTSRQSFYVAASRAKHHLSLYTADIAELTQRVQLYRAKENASDYIPLFQVVTSHAQTQKENDSAHASLPDGRNVGEPLGDRITESLTAALWRDNNSEKREQRTSETGNRLHHSTGRYSSLVKQLEQAGSELNRSASTTEPNPSQIVRTIKQQRHWRQLGQATAVLSTIGEGISRLEYHIGQQQQLSAQVGRFLNQLQSVIGTNQLKKKLNYQKLWEQYSQGIQNRTPRTLDKLVVSRAFCDGHSRKNIALMLAAGSTYVRQVHSEAGQHQAMFYVQQTVKEICYQAAISKVNKKSHQLEM
jgi:ATP-dependent exoDNAse (exonuclease V) alpha subunit